MLALLVVALAAPAWAVGMAEQTIFGGSRDVRLSSGAVFDGKPVPPGLYALQWGTNGDLERVQVQLSRGRRVVASVTARLIEHPVASPYDSVLLSRVRTGDLELAEIRFAGKTKAIALFDATGAVAGSR
jgi:hypothetical protein